MEAERQPDGDDNEDELDRAFPGGFVFIRDVFTINRHVSVESEPGMAAAFADSETDRTIIGNRSSSVTETGAIVSGVKDAVHPTGKGEIGEKKQVEAPDSVDAGWLYSRCGETSVARGVFILCVFWILKCI